ncbi:MAG: CsbD family protein [Gemmatimonadota bacterium]
MNWDTIAGNWKNAKGKVREQWGELTDDDLDVIAGKRDQLVGKIQARYGKGRDEVEREVSEYEARHESTDFSR